MRQVRDVRKLSDREPHSVQSDTKVSASSFACNRTNRTHLCASSEPRVRPVKPIPCTTANTIHANARPTPMPPICSHKSQQPRLSYGLRDSTQSAAQSSTHPAENEVQHVEDTALHRLRATREANGRESRRQEEVGLKRNLDSIGNVVKAEVVAIVPARPHHIDHLMRNQQASMRPGLAAPHAKRNRYQSGNAEQPGQLAHKRVAEDALLEVRARAGVRCQSTLLQKATVSSVSGPELSTQAKRKRTMHRTPARVSVLEYHSRLSSRPSTANQCQQPHGRDQQVAKQSS